MTASHSRHTRHTLHCLLFFGISVSISFYVLVLVSALYLGHVAIDPAISFWSNDFPRPMPASAYPVAFGNHYFGDFLIPFRLAQQPSPYIAPDFIMFGYLPLAAVLLGPLTILGYWCAFVVFLAVSLTLLAMSIGQSLPSDDRVSRALLVGVLLTSGPFVNAIDRGNLGLLMVSLICLGVVAGFSDRTSASGLLFGLAASMKFYPAVLGVFFLRKRQWKSLAIMVSSFVLSILVPAALYRHGAIENLTALKNQFLGSSNFKHADNIHAFNNSFYALFSSMSKSEVFPLHEAGTLLIEHYYPVVATVVLVAVLLGIHPRVSDVSHLSCICVAMVFVPNIVGSYVVLIMFAPLLLASSRFSRGKSRPTWTENMVLLLLLLMMVPKGLPFPNPLGVWSQTAATFSSVVNPILGLAILSVSFVEFGSRSGTERAR